MSGVLERPHYPCLLNMVYLCHKKTAGAGSELDGWIPIDVDHDNAGIKLCRLNFAKHAENPAQLPMFKDLVQASPCGEKKHISMDELANLPGARDPNARAMFGRFSPGVGGFTLHHLC